MKQYLKRPCLKLLWYIGSWISHFFDRPIQKERISNILIFQGGGIGDVIRTFPAIQSLHEEFPSASITMLTQFGDNLFRLFATPEAISEYIIYDLSGTHKSFSSKMSLICSLRKRKFDLIFSPNYGLGMIEATVISFLIGAPDRIGYDKRGTGFLFTTKKDLQNDKTILEQNLGLLSHAGFSIKKQEAYLRVPDEATVSARSLLREQGICKDDYIIVISPQVKADVLFKSFPEHRSWPRERYIEFIMGITGGGHHRVKVILLGHKPQTPLESESYRQLIKKNTRVFNLMGKTSLVEAAAVISLANLFVGNDSGPLHIAIALGIPVIALFGPTSPRQIMPDDPRFVPISSCRLIKEYNLPDPCYTHDPLFKDPSCGETLCISRITVSEVKNIVEKLIPG